MSFPQVPTLSSVVLGDPRVLIISAGGAMNSQLHRTRTRTFSGRSYQKGLANILVGLFSIALWISPASGTVTVVSQLSNSSVVIFEDQPARFIPERVTIYGIQGLVVYADPPTACTAVKKPPDYYPVNVNWILVARRYECDFQKKIENAQNAGYSAIIVHNVGSNSTEAMGADNPSKLYIYACFIGEYHGHLLRDFYTFDKEYFVRIQDDFSMNAYLLPFAIVVGVCFIVMLIFMLWQQVVRWIRERRRSRRRKLPPSALKKLPVNKWTKGDPYETCAICLEDFVEQDKVRVLPCSHGFHSVCIDPWLTKGRRVCPICKRKVILADEHFPFSETDTDDETAPLLGPSSVVPPNTASSSTTSTFVQPENPFRRAQRRAHLQAAYSDTASNSGSAGSSDSDIITSHRSLPVLAQVHNLSRPQPATLRPEPQSTQQQSPVAGPSFGDTSMTPMSQSRFYVSCDGETAEDEEMLDVTNDSAFEPSAPDESAMVPIETGVEVTNVFIIGGPEVPTPGSPVSRNAIV